MLEFYDYVRSNAATIQSEDDLWKSARELDQQGNRSLMAFMLGRKDLSQLFSKVHKAENAANLFARQAMTRLDILQHAAANATCVCEHPRRWFNAAEQVVNLNEFHNMEVQLAVLGALVYGREKKRNIFIIGLTNRAKSFVMKPLSVIYQSFVPPDSGSHQLADLRGTELVWLNDFTWDPSFLAWSKFKTFMEGSPVRVAVPKTQGSNYTFETDSPVLGTSPTIIAHKISSETQQMNSRVTYFTFYHFFDPDTCPKLKECQKCCAQWYLQALPYLEY